MALTLSLPAHDEQTSFNARRWREVLTDAELLKIEGQLESARGRWRTLPNFAPDFPDVSR
jgi:hypothetical protein